MEFVTLTVIYEVNPEENCLQTVIEGASSTSVILSDHNLLSTLPNSTSVCKLKTMKIVVSR